MCRFPPLTVVMSVLILWGCVEVAAGQTEADPQLARKVTLDCAGVRLHTAIERINEQAGVTIRVGKSKDDWKVRDLPVLVCARDISLGNLLRGIADSTHLLFSRTKTADGVTYRIWRDFKREQKLAGFERAREAAATSAVCYDWDLMCRMKDVPESDPNNPADQTDSDSIDRRLRASVSRILSELGLGIRDRVLAGDVLILGLENSPESVRPHITAAFREWRESIARIGYIPLPLDELLDQCCVRIGAESTFGELRDQLVVELNMERGCRTEDYRSYQPWVQKHMPGFPSRPEVPEANLGLDDPGGRYTQLLPSEKGGPSFLDTKVKIAAPGEGKKPMYWDLLCAVSKCIGYSIVAEGSAARCVSRTASQRYKLPPLFGRDVTVREVLEFPTVVDRVVWYLDEQSKLILGLDKEWNERLKALVPEKLLLDMRAKVNGAGVDLDDLEPLAGLSKDQVGEWINSCPEYPEIEELSSAIRPFRVAGDAGGLWKLYFTLAPEVRKQAKSGQRVSLAGVDRAWLCKLLRGFIAHQVDDIYSMRWDPVHGPKGSLPAIYCQTFTDPDALPNLCIWLEREDMTDMPEPYKGKHNYILHLQDEKEGGLSYVDRSLICLPVSAPKPKAETPKTPTSPPAGL